MRKAGACSANPYALHGNEGFTLIELIAVLMLMLVAAAVVLPGFPGFARRERLRTTASRLAGMARYAGDWSVAHDRSVVLSYEEDSHSFRLTTDETVDFQALAVPVSEDLSQNSDTAVSLDEEWSKLSLPLDVTFETAGEGASGGVTGTDSVRFCPDGRSDAAALTLVSGDMRYVVRVAGRRGRVSVSAGSGTESAVPEGSGSDAS